MSPPHRDLAGPVAIAATLLAVAVAATLIVQTTRPAARFIDSDRSAATVRIHAAATPTTAPAVPDRPDRLFIPLPLAEIRLRTGALPLALPAEEATLLRSGWEGPLGPDRWFRAAGVHLEYRLADGGAVTLVARPEAAARARPGQAVAVRGVAGLASSEPTRLSWAEGGQRYELTSADLDVAALVRLAVSLSADP